MRNAKGAEMMTLSEIEERATKGWSRRVPLTLSWEIDQVQQNVDVMLLIRAVRQLGARVKYAETFYIDSGEWKPIDPDVLALLEEGGE